VKLYYCDDHVIPLPPGHKFPARKYRLLRELLAADGRFRFEPAPFADLQSIALAHDEEYIRRFLDGTIEPRIMRRIGFPWSPELVRRTLASVGGTVCATDDALALGLGGNLAGGTHHATRSEGAGFCVFNDIAIAIRGLFANRRIARAAVIDLDVHQGDGTALLFEVEPRVLTLSLHGANNFPFRKQRSRIDVELPDGVGDAEYLSALEQVLPRVFDFAPEIVFYQSGVDTLASDRLGRLAMTPDGLRRRDEMVLQCCRSRRIPVVITLGGGYSEPISLTAQAHATTFRVASQTFLTADGHEYARITSC
jgi:acetoin utilization deacetylase AcuC-like enzyme